MKKWIKLILAILIFHLVGFLIIIKMPFILTSLGISMLIQIILFIPSYFFKTDKLTDMGYGLSFILLGMIPFLSNNIVVDKLLLFGMILAWGLRLIIYLLIRVIKIGKDARFDQIRVNFAKFLTFWLGQGFSVWVIMIPTLIYLNSNTSGLGILSYIGFFIWISGLKIETIADLQKFRFKNNPKNKGKWINKGLWKYSRHPNYFGEILCWVGVYLFCLNQLSGLNALIGFLSPLFISLLLLFVTGIPKLEEIHNKKYGNKKEYQEYKKRTSMLLLWLPKEKN
jgi:steroid 5-alpha reductase family enzyme